MPNQIVHILLLAAFLNVIAINTRSSLKLEIISHLPFLRHVHSPFHSDMFVFFRFFFFLSIHDAPRKSGWRSIFSACAIWFFSAIAARRQVFIINCSRLTLMVSLHMPPKMCSVKVEVQSFGKRYTYNYIRPAIKFDTLKMGYVLQRKNDDFGMCGNCLYIMHCALYAVWVCCSRWICVVVACSHFSIKLSTLTHMGWFFGAIGPQAYII